MPPVFRSVTYSTVDTSDKEALAHKGQEKGASESYTYHLGHYPTFTLPERETTWSRGGFLQYGCSYLEIKGKVSPTQFSASKVAAHLITDTFYEGITRVKAVLIDEH